MNSKIRCVMCGNLPAIRRNMDGELVGVYWEAPQTHEPLCQFCNATNDSIAQSKFDGRIGEMKIIKLNSIK